MKILLLSMILIAVPMSLKAQNDNRTEVVRDTEYKHFLEGAIVRVSDTLGHLMGGAVSNATGDLHSHHQHR